ncbi:sprouty-related, EVH1 domain-containing protein 2 isoform X2 [Copidosoma floridanum]|uniref:sprouty-related, EVH1 domain-containing protein 2 isoform X2 n=1 Tax=Copidosoma floridanum TaxID=29053 RepID=UPI0006C99418|nr:sprouty-related, EVH1 domain-containing protein 2 isoform X2 [Copidosoma floridanum]
MIDSADDVNTLVNVRAQVMTRDDTTGGWLPFKGGGLINVSVIRRPNVHTNLVQDTNGNQDNGVSESSPSTGYRPANEYIIYGRRAADNHDILNCLIEKNFVYNKVMPTFHHWHTGEYRYGLTFQTAADARAFDKGVRMAIEELFDDGGEEDVFMSLNLPGEPPEPLRPSPAAVLTSSAITPTSTDITSLRNAGLTVKNRSQCSDHFDPQKPSANYNSHPNNGPSIIKMPPPHLLQSADLASDNYPYVQLTTLNHEYLYPVIDEQHQQQQRVTKVNRSNSAGSLKKPDIIVSQPTKGVEGLAIKGGRENLRLRCKHCQELFMEQNNPRGACEYAPDPVRTGIAQVSCLTCAHCMLYHCMSDAEGEFAQNPCSCSAEEGCGRRWFGLALLSMIVPCLWMYPPLRALHWCGMSCGICGGRHRAAD